VTFTLGAFSPFDDGRGALPLRGLRLDGRDDQHPGALALATNGSASSRTLSVPHEVGQTTASIKPVMSVDVPSHGYAGQYRMSVAVSIAGDTVAAAQ
jgi:hypothetical protein